MKKVFLHVFMAVIGVFIISLSHADEITNNFRDHLNRESLDALAKDLGAMMGGGSFHQGEALGIPGFDVGVHAVEQGISDSDVILRDDGSILPTYWAQGEIGLPLKIDLIGRAGKMLGANTFGGGLRWGIFKPSVPGLPSVAISGLYGAAKHDYYDLKTVSANAVLSIDLPIIRPYVGAGYDYSKLDPTSKGVGANTDALSLQGKASGYRAEIGVNLTFIPFTYITLGGGLANGQKMYHGGLGIEF